MEKKKKNFQLKSPKVFGLKDNMIRDNDFLWQLEQVYLHRTDQKQQVIIPVVQSLPKDRQELVDKYLNILTLFPRCRTLKHVLCRLSEISNGTEPFLPLFMFFSSSNSVLTSFFPSYYLPPYPYYFLE